MILALEDVHFALHYAIVRLDILICLLNIV